MATNRFDFKGRTPYEIVNNSTQDISEITTFSGSNGVGF